MPDDALWTRAITLTSQATSAAQARRFVRQHLDAHHLEALVEDVELVASELATNAMQHAGTAFHLSLQAFGHTLRLTVSDGSRTGPVRLAAQRLDTGGRGLEIVELLSRAWGFLEDAGGKSVWAEFDPVRARTKRDPYPRSAVAADRESEDVNRTGPWSLPAPERLAEVFVEVADTLVDDFDVIEFLQMLCVHTSDIVEARAAGLLLADQDDRLQLMAASDERAQMVELFQVQADEGPCQDCFTQGTAVVNADLQKAFDRWPRFAPRAVAAGYRSVHAFPLRLRNEVIGALNLFGTSTGDMSEADARVLQALADVATIGLLQQRAIHERDLLSDQLQSALTSRIIIEQAKGALAQIHGITPDLAFTVLRTYCREHNRRLGEVADAVVRDPGEIADLTTRRS